MPRHYGGGGSRAGFSSGGGGGKEQLREVKISKAASYVLRHGATKEGLKLDERGFINVGDLVSSIFIDRRCTFHRASRFLLKPRFPFRPPASMLQTRLTLPL